MSFALEIATVFLSKPIWRKPRWKESELLCVRRAWWAGNSRCIVRLRKKRPKHKTCMEHLRTFQMISSAGCFSLNPCTCSRLWWLFLFFSGGVCGGRDPGLPLCGRQESWGLVWMSEQGDRHAFTGGGQRKASRQEEGGAANRPVI